MIELLIEYKYIAFFIGMLFGGDLVLITGIYLATRNYFDITLLVLIAFIATMLSDYVWYFLGKHMTKEKLLRYNIFKKHEHLINRLSQFTEKHGFKAIFYSKFIYGTRTIVQILAGMERLSFFKYSFVNSIGTLGYIAVILLLGYGLHLSTENIQTLLHNGALTLSLFILIVTLVNIWINKQLKKRLLR